MQWQSRAHRARAARARPKALGETARGKRRGWLGGAGEGAAQVILGVGYARISLADLVN